MKLFPPKCRSSINPLNPSGLTNCQSGRSRERKEEEKKKTTVRTRLTAASSSFPFLLIDSTMLPSWTATPGLGTFASSHLLLLLLLLLHSLPLWAPLSSLSGAVSSAWSLVSCKLWYFNPRSGGRMYTRFSCFFFLPRPDSYCHKQYSFTFRN